MIACLVQTRSPLSSEHPLGTVVFYVASFETENEALEATLSNIPDGWTVEAVIGEASADQIARMGIGPGDVRQAGT